MKKIHIDIASMDSHFEAVKKLQVFNKLYPYEVEIHFNMDLSQKKEYEYVYGDILVLVIAAFKRFKEIGNKYSANIEISTDDEKVAYADKINFFKILGAEYESGIKRKAGKGKFVEIVEFNSENIYIIQDQINCIFYEKMINLKVQEMLYYTLNEIMDNVIVHSTKGTGFSTAQYFRNEDEIRLIICDYGIGIHESLVSGENHKYVGISEKDALKICIQKGVTNGKGAGFGLFATSEFIKRNQGELLVYSGNHYLCNKNGRYSVNKGNYWPGTFVFLKINTNIAVDYTDIFPQNHTLSDDYAEFLERQYPTNNNLW